MEPTVFAILDITETETSAKNVMNLAVYAQDLKLINVKLALMYLSFFKKDFAQRITPVTLDFSCQKMSAQNAQITVSFVKVISIARHAHSDIEYKKLKLENKKLISAAKFVVMVSNIKMNAMMEILKMVMDVAAVVISKSDGHAKVDLLPEKVIAINLFLIKLFSQAKVSSTLEIKLFRVSELHTYPHVLLTTNVQNASKF